MTLKPPESILCEAVLPQSFVNQNISLHLEIGRSVENQALRLLSRSMKTNIPKHSESMAATRYVCSNPWGDTENLAFDSTPCYSTESIPIRGSTLQTVPGIRAIPRYCQYRQQTRSPQACLVNQLPFDVKACTLFLPSNAAPPKHECS